jgi:hypothetical protein
MEEMDAFLGLKGVSWLKDSRSLFFYLFFFVK